MPWSGREIGIREDLTSEGRRGEAATDDGSDSGSTSHGDGGT